MQQNNDYLTYQSHQSHQPFSSSPHGHGVSYLPAYLIGEPHHSVASSSRSWMGGSSPPRSVQQKKGLTNNTTTQQNISTNRDSVLGYTPNDSQTRQKAGAPPCVGLMESLTNPDSRQSFNAGSPALFNQFSGPGGGVYSGMSANQIDRLDGGSFRNYSYREPAGFAEDECEEFSTPFKDKKKGTWVTVFGFPPSSTSYILEEFAQYGNILKHVIAPNGNWMDVLYESDLQACKALSKNGKVFAGNIMIGVVSRLDKDVYTASSPQTLNAVVGRDESFNQAKPSSMRNLASSTYYPTKNYPMMDNDHFLPERNDSYFSKAMNFVFGW